VIADDVKAQVEFNPALVADYRLIGYENRRLANRDFADDSKDAGEIGLGTDVVLMFELTLREGGSGGLKYGGATDYEDTGAYGDEFFEVRIRYKNPGESKSNLISVPVKTDRLLARNSGDYNFAASVAAFGHLLRNSQYRGDVELAKVIEVAEGNLGADEGKLRKEFVRILKEYQTLRR
jgi:Ca-activated chloride channel family protein